MRKGTIAVISSIIGVLTGTIASGVVTHRSIEYKDKKTDKLKAYYDILNQWLILKNKGRSLDKYFIDNGYKTIAIYGMGELGNRLYEELKDSDSVKVKYGIDINANATYSELAVVGPEDKLEEIDVIIVAAIFVFDEVEEKLSKTVTCPIISLEDVIFTN